MVEVEPTASGRKLKAKRHNERVKLAASALNTLAIGIIGAAFIVPGVTSLDNVRWVWIPAAFILHLIGQVLLGTLKSED